MRKNDVKQKPGFARNSGFCFWSARRFALGVLVLTADFDGDGQVTFADFLSFAGPLHFFTTYARVIRIAGVLSCCLK